MIGSIGHLSRRQALWWAILVGVASGIAIALLGLPWWMTFPINGLFGWIVGYYVIPWLAPRWRAFRVGWRAARPKQPLDAP